MSEEKIKELETKLVNAEAKNQQLDERAKRFEGQMVDLQKQLERFKDVDLDALKAAKDENEVLKRQTAGFDEEKFQQTVNEKIQKEREEWQNKLAALDATNKELGAKVYDFEVVGQSMQVLAPKLKDDMAPFIKDVLRKSLKKEGDKLVVYNGADKVFSKKDVSQQMEAEEYYGIIQEQYPSAFKADIPTGTMNKGERISGASNNGDAIQRLQNPDLASSLSAADKMKAGLELAQKYRKF